MSQAPLTIERSIEIPVSREFCFKTFTSLHPADYIHHDKLIARITSVRVLTGKAFDHQGARQQIDFADGAQIEEEVLSWIDNQQIVYSGRGFSQPVVNWVDHTQASFEFQKVNESTTRFVWRYNFFLKESFLNPIKKRVFQAAVINFIWSRMMTKTLSNLVQIMSLRSSVRESTKGRGKRASS